MAWLHRDMRGAMVSNASKVICLTLSLLAAASSNAAPVSFNRDVRPILSDRCFHCHGPDDHDRKAKLRLDRADGDQGAYRIHDGAQGVKPGSLEKSELWYRITTDDGDDVMPPADSHKKPLTAAQKAIIKQWIEEGAEYDAWWAFKKPVITTPALNRSLADRFLPSRGWGNGAIDRYVDARLKTESLAPSPEADKRTLLRRLTFDLTGLPPTLEELAAFDADTSPDAYEKRVDALLARPQYGEHMTRYWADLVRLADTNGLHSDRYRDFSTYRDWVIRAFNSNMPFDQFVRDQVAGDLYEKPTVNQQVASGFNRLNLMFERGSVLPEESLYRNVLDRVEAVGTAFLGLTVQCAQCHDHKYDPISQREFFQLYAFFNNFSGDPQTGPAEPDGIQSPFVQVATAEQKAKLAELDEQLQALQAKLAATQKSGALPPASTPTVQHSTFDGKIDEVALADTALTQTEVSGLAGEQAAVVISEYQAKVSKINQERQLLLSQTGRAMVMSEGKPPRKAYIRIRGAYDNPGEEVQRGTPAFLPPLHVAGNTPSRMDLANWLVSPEHPLTARVTANRLWQQFFGVGLVKTSEDFGAQGEWPSHPQLLDYLAVRFMESGWDVKGLVREIVLSATYRQQSDAPAAAYQADPENRLLARGSRYRMDAEMIRDQLLMVSGKLNTQMCGKSVKPPQPPGLWKSVTMTKEYFKPDSGPAILRRSLYTFWKRVMPPPQMSILNAPSREYCVARRERTNTPLQALVLMNEPEYLRLAHECAQRTLREAGNDPAIALPRLYERITSHTPAPEELAILAEARDDLMQYYRDRPALAQQIAPGSKDTVHTAVWAVLAHSILNLEKAKVRR